MDACFSSVFSWWIFWGFFASWDKSCADQCEKNMMLNCYNHKTKYLNNRSGKQWSKKYFLTVLEEFSRAFYSLHFQNRLITLALFSFIPFIPKFTWWNHVKDIKHDRDRKWDSDGEEKAYSCLVFAETLHRYAWISYSIICLLLKMSVFDILGIRLNNQPLIIPSIVFELY